jgi:hypothetical protein
VWRGYCTGILETVEDHESADTKGSRANFRQQGDDVRKKLSAAAGLVTIAAAGALITSTPAFAESAITSITAASAVASPASATLAQQATVSTATRTAANDGRRRHRHRRHHRHHRRHHRHHRHHHRHHWGY